MQCYLDKNGFLRMRDDNVSRIQNAYPQGEWFTMSIDINFESHLWRYYLNGECIGSYYQENPARQSIASLALWPDGDDSVFYVDNISFEHKGKADDLSFKNDAAILQVINPDAELPNTGTTTLTGINGREQLFGY